eukprot:CAMPEP_0197486912 /NCGR_PEP_ID=MMETSP1311-20131121/1887_1 /TAXON_ID=464262 /ORGANISM="Genus nov. species nov., Strain RCC856" /LENGTH=753 /DNA_ID=CAMNT_0043030273 /DNA_START=205 /DNA_END=2466 /DNA_ORIENTATION=+
MVVVQQQQQRFVASKGAASSAGCRRCQPVAARRSRRSASPALQRCRAVSQGPLNSSNANSNPGDDSFSEGDASTWRESFVSLDEIQSWRENGPATPLLDTVNFPVHIKNFNLAQLKTLSKEVRSEVINSVSNSGGHLGSSLGVVELTVALHHVFNTPEDKIIFDVGHQAYPHKILTGRRREMSGIRKSGGLSGFTNRAESEYDPFGAGHSSTSISAGLGMAVGRDIKGRKNNVISVIGDGAITGGMAYEAMNNAGYLDSNMIIILNDNKQVSLPTQYNGKSQDPVGGLSNTLARIQANKPLRELREIAKDLTRGLPGPLPEVTAKIDEYARGMISGSGSTLFEELGLYYIGPVDGHNLDELTAILKEVKNTESIGPVLIHVMTEKGSGYLPAMTASDKMHGVSSYDVTTGKQNKPQTKTMSYTNYFADSLIAEAEKDSRIVGIHAAMGGGTGLNRFEKRFEDRTFDVGIAEQHAVTFAAGLATEGLIPMCAIYSTFLQRGYDQIIHDVALQNLPVRFAMDRAGLVGADGATHCGAFDVAYLACIPNMVVMAPSNEAELCHMVATSIAIDDRPSAFRFPRGNGIGVDMQALGVASNYKGQPVEVGKGVVRREGTDVALVGYGQSVNACLAAAEMLSEHAISVTVVDARFCKPLDTQLIRRLAKSHGALITVEEGSVGGFGSHVLQFLSLEGLLDDGKLKVRPMCLPDRFIEHASPAEQLEEAGLTASQVASTVLTVLGRPRDSLEVLQPNLKSR